MMRFSLKRVINSGHFMPEIDGLRYVTIMPVLLDHAFMNQTALNALLRKDPKLKGEKIETS